MARLIDRNSAQRYTVFAVFFNLAYGHSPEPLNSMFYAKCAEVFVGSTVLTELDRRNSHGKQALTDCSARRG